MQGGRKGVDTPRWKPQKSCPTHGRPRRYSQYAVVAQGTLGRGQGTEEERNPVGSSVGLRASRAQGLFLLCHSLGVGGRGLAWLVTKYFLCHRDPPRGQDVGRPGE